MTSTLAPSDAELLDLRGIAPRERHALIFGRFEALQPGQALRLVNDHDPSPLRGQFEQRCEGQFNWAALEAGPARWSVLITRTASLALAAGGGSCCSGGACCG